MNRGVFASFLMIPSLFIQIPSFYNSDGRFRSITWQEYQPLFTVTFVALPLHVYSTRNTIASSTIQISNSLIGCHSSNLSLISLV